MRQNRCGTLAQLIVAAEATQHLLFLLALPSLLGPPTLIGRIRPVCIGAPSLDHLVEAMWRALTGVTVMPSGLVAVLRPMTSLNLPAVRYLERRSAIALRKILRRRTQRRDGTEVGQGWSRRTSYDPRFHEFSV